MLGFLVLAGIGAAVSAPVRAARSNEIRNRLGLGEVHQPVGTAARIEWAFREFGSSILPRGSPDWYIRGVAQVFRQDLERSLRWLGMDAKMEPTHPDDGFIPLLAGWLYEVKKEAAKTDVAHADVTSLRSEAVITLRDWWRTVHPDASRLPFQAALTMAEDWHHAMKKASVIAIDGASSETPHSDAGGVEVYRWASSGVHVVRLITRKQHVQEGTTMDHCVGGYWNDTRDGRSLIFSFRDDKNEPFLTVEVRPVTLERDEAELVQIRGPHDWSPEPKDLPFIRSFLHEFLGLSMNRYLGAPVILSKEGLTDIGHDIGLETAARHVVQALWRAADRLKIESNGGSVIRAGIVAKEEAATPIIVFTSIFASSIIPGSDLDRYGPDHASTGQGSFSIRDEREGWGEPLSVVASPWFGLADGGSWIGALNHSEPVLDISMGLQWNLESLAWLPLVHVHTDLEHAPVVLLGRDDSLVDAILRSEAVAIEGAWNPGQAGNKVNPTWNDPIEPGRSNFTRSVVLLPHKAFLVDLGLDGSSR